MAKLKAYPVVINGLETRLMLSEDDAKRRGLNEAKDDEKQEQKPRSRRSAPKSKSKKPANKADSPDSDKSAPEPEKPAEDSSDEPTGDETPDRGF